MNSKYIWLTTTSLRGSHLRDWLFCCVEAQQFNTTQPGGHHDASSIAVIWRSRHEAARSIYGVRKGCYIQNTCRKIATFKFRNKFRHPAAGQGQDSLVTAPHPIPNAAQHCPPLLRIQQSARNHVCTYKSSGSFNCRENSCRAKHQQIIARAVGLPTEGLVIHRLGKASDAVALVASISQALAPCNVASYRRDTYSVP